MDTSVVTALAALGGSLVGGLTTFASTWINQRYQGSRERTANEIAKREILYGEFINEATRVGMEAVEHDMDSVTSLTSLFAVLNRIRLTASTDVLEAAEGVVAQVAGLYMGENKSPRELYEQMQRGDGSQMDPLKKFGEACRRELQAWR
jgi:hypothetical protein